MRHAVLVSHPESMTFDLNSFYNGPEIQTIMSHYYITQNHQFVQGFGYWFISLFLNYIRPDPMVVESTSLDWVLGGGQAFKAFDRAYRLTHSINHAYMFKYTIVINYIPARGRLGILYFSNTLEYHRFFPCMFSKCEPLGDLTIEPVPPNGKRFKGVIPSNTFSSVAATTTLGTA